MPGFRIDNLQYANWSEKIFRQLRQGGVDAIHVTIAYHENFRETVLNFERWNRWFQQFPDLIMKGQWANDVGRVIRGAISGHKGWTPVWRDPAPQTQ